MQEGRIGVQYWESKYEVGLGGRAVWEEGGWEREKKKNESKEEEEGQVFVDVGM